MTMGLDLQAAAHGIGDVNSNTKGSGARYNVGKPALELIPLRLLASALADPATAWLPEQLAALNALDDLGRFQIDRSRGALIDATRKIGAHAWVDCARVFDYGRRKYAAWNWAKGMPWSVPLACAARHLERVIVYGEADDSESGLPHRGHVLCNVVMLLHYLTAYPEGDDLPPAELFH